MAETTETETSGDTVVLGETRWWPALPALAVGVAVVAGAALLTGGVPVYLLAVVTVAVVLALRTRGTAVLADDLGLLVRRPGRLTRSYAWAEIERIGWIGAGPTGARLMVEPRGGPGTTPGPHTARQVARVWSPRRDPDPLPELRDRHRLAGLHDLGTP